MKKRIFIWINIKKAIISIRWPPIFAGTQRSLRATFAICNCAIFSWRYCYIIAPPTTLKIHQSHTNEFHFKKKLTYLQVDYKFVCIVAMSFVEVISGTRPIETFTFINPPQFKWIFILQTLCKNYILTQLKMRMSKGLRHQHFQLGSIICGAFSFKTWKKSIKIYLGRNLRACYLFACW